MTEETSFFDTGVNGGPQQPAADAASTRPQESSTATAERPKAARRAPGGGLKRPSGMALGMGIVGAATIGFVGWALFSDPTPAARSGPHPTSATAIAVAHEPESAVSKAPQIVEAVPPAHVEADIPVIGPAPSASVASPPLPQASKNPLGPSTAVDASTATQLEARVSKTEESLSHVDTALATISGQIAALNASVAGLKAPARANTKPKGAASTKRSTQATAGAKGDPKDKADKPVRSLSGVTYSVHTIARGIAWIQAGDHLDIVQPGDRIGTVRVLAVDPIERKVVTSDGVIR